MAHKQRFSSRGVGCAAAIALLAAGCAATPTGSSNVPAVTPKASLALRFAAPRRIQAQIFEATGATVSITIPGKPSITVPIAVDVMAEEFDGAIDDLPEGDATVRIDLYRGQDFIGTGEALVPLILGQRSNAYIQLWMDSRGRTDFIPLSPLPPHPPEPWPPEEQPEVPPPSENPPG
ncbi:MAG TPA: hypothetical protein V6D00_13900 [Pantanalinema sp.]